VRTAASLAHAWCLAEIQVVDYYFRPVAVSYDIEVKRGANFQRATEYLLSLPELLSNRVRFVAATAESNVNERRSVCVKVRYLFKSPPMVSMRYVNEKHVVVSLLCDALGIDTVTLFDLFKLVARCAEPPSTTADAV